MTQTERPLILLGPQRVIVTAGDAVTEVAGDQPVATITAGWHEREHDDGELNEVLRGRSHNLALNDRAERVWREDEELRVASDLLHGRLRLLRRTYALQLTGRMDHWRALEQMDGDLVVLGPEREAALSAVRQLDARHMSRVSELHEEFVRTLRPLQRPALLRERQEIADTLQGMGAIAVAGGHIAILLDRCRMFGIRELIEDLPVVAWSGGAMAMTQHVVLFHDSPPQGFGHAEAFDHGLGLATGVVVLPHAADRLMLEDTRRVGLMVRRFGPARCLPLDGGEGIQYRDGAWQPYGDARCMREDGVVEALTS